jgi:triacylglycerol lipase
MITTTFKEFNISCQNHDKCLGDLLFIHGFCVDHSYFTAAKELSKYFNIYMIDLPGHGANTEGATQDDMHLQKLADYIVSYVEYKKLNNFYLMGHSMGGGLVSMVENQISDKIRKLILLCPFNFGGAFAGFKSFYIFYPHNMEEKNNLLQILYAPDNYAKFSKDPH